MKLISILFIVLATCGASSAQPNKGRMRLERLIRHELIMLPYYGVFDRLSFSIEGSTVKLMGDVTRPTLKTTAENVIKDIEGIDKIVNEINVLPLSPMDDQLRFALYRAIYGHPALNRYALQAVPSIHIIVDKGNVILDGVAANSGDSTIANIQANGVAGVFSVKNQLRLENQELSSSDSKPTK